MKIRFLFLLPALLFCGCYHFTKVKYIDRYVYIKCRIPYVPKANLELIDENSTYPEKLRVILNNYLKLQRENELLREAIKTCQ